MLSDLVATTGGTVDALVGVTERDIEEDME